MVWVQKRIEDKVYALDFLLGRLMIKILTEARADGVQDSGVHFDHL